MNRRCLPAATAVALLSLVHPRASAPVSGQVAEHPLDPFGISIPYRLVHLIHSSDTTKAGTTGYLRAYDPYLLYTLGRDLIHRQFELKHGVLGRSAELTVPLYVGVVRNSSLVHGGVPRFARDHAASCGMCHSSVYREPSAGQTIGSTGGLGRNTSHFFGAGLVEMIGAQVTRMVLNAYDRNRNGIIDRDEIRTPSPVRIAPAPGAEPIDFGDLSPGPDGVPRLNDVFRIWYVDGAGRVVPDAFTLADPRVQGFGFVMQPFGWGRGRVAIHGLAVSQGGEAATLREFYTVASDFHMGLQAYDPTQQGADPALSGFGGLAKVSLNGAQQYDFGGSVDLGLRRTPTGVSLDDPDADGHPSELTEGDVDAAEFFLLHAPAPAVRAVNGTQAAATLRRIGCTRCHVENWQLPARDDARGFSGDRRLFRFETHARLASEGAPELVGRIVPLVERDAPGKPLRPARTACTINGVYSDFKHWDIGANFYERRFDGSVQTTHRTAPLWGVGTTGPYGHSGNYPDLRSVILAHGGAALKARDAFVALDQRAQQHVTEYLASLVLYQTDEIPADINRDGVISEHFNVAGQDVGYERFNPHFLMKVPPKYQVLGTYVHPNGRELPAMLIMNIEEAFGLTLPYRVDLEHDGFPDVLGAIVAPKRSESKP